MATNHVSLDRATRHGTEFDDAVRELRENIDLFKHHKETMVQMLSGSSSDAASFAYIAAQYGVEGVDQAAKNASAKRMFDELSSMIGNLHASLAQFLAILG